MIEQPARRRDQHVDAFIQSLVLFIKRYAADQKRQGEFMLLAVHLKLFGDLSRQFACWLYYQGARHACTGAAMRQHIDHG